MWVLVGGVFLIAAAPVATASSETTVVAVTPSSPPVSPVEDSDSEPSSTGESDGVLAKIAPGLQARADRPSKDLAGVIIHTVDVPALSAELASLGAMRVVEVDGEIRSMPYVAKPWGAVGTPTSIFVQLPERSLRDVASLDFVLFVDETEIQTTTFTQDAIYLEERRSFMNFVERLRADVKDKGPRPYANEPGVSPTSWAVAREHKAWDAWQVTPTCCMGDGVNVAVVDTGEDFGHPSLNGQWAVAPSGAWAGWPIMFHPASMEGLFGQGWWTAGSDLDRLPVPYWLSANDGDSWYTNTDYTANDSDLDGYLTFADLTINPETTLLQRTARANPQQYGNFDPATAQLRINRDYYVGCAGLPGPCIQSQSGFYRLGLNRDDTLTGLYGEKVGVLLVDSTVAWQYDTVYVDLDFDFDFTNDKPVTRADPIATADIYDEIAGGPGQDGVPDVSGGLLFFIADSTPVTQELIINGATGTETTAQLLPKWDFDNDGTMESASAAVDVDGWFNFKPATELWLRDPAGLPYYFPGATENILEEYTSPVGRVETAYSWQLDGADTSFGPLQLMTGRSVPTNALLNGPAGDFVVSLVYDPDLQMCDPLLVVCVPYTGPEGPANYTLNPDTGQLLLVRDIPDNYVLVIIYQLGTYTLEPVSGTIRFWDPVTGFAETIPAGWDLLADYETGLPIPYSQVYGPAHGYETFIPGNGDLVAFHGEFDNGQSHGTFVSSTVAATPYGNLASTQFEVFGTAPRAKIIGIAACCNVPGPIGLFGSIEDQRTFAAVGYDGRPATGDEAQIMSNSFGSTQVINTGFSSQDRWLIDYWYRYPFLTPLIALGNNGPGYGTNAPGGSSPGVIGVGAGNSMDYRIQGFGDTGSAAGEVPDCSLAGVPPDPRLCFGIGSPFGPGPYGEMAFFSSRGPTLLGSPKPDIVSVGQFGWEAAPLNVYCVDPTGAPDPAWCDGNFAFDLFSGTSMATPVTAGVTALIVQASQTAHGGALPTNALVKELLKSGADDLHRDILQSGAGWTNALRSVHSALDVPAYIGIADGVTSNMDFWIPGNYQGSRAIGFVNHMMGGSSDATTFTLTNRNQGTSATVSIADATYQRAARYTYAFTLATGAGQNFILRPTTTCGANTYQAGLYASDGVTLIQAFPFDTYWNTADFAKVTYTYDAVAFPGPTAWRLDTFNWYDSNANCLYGGAAERNRMSVSVAAGANSVWDTFHVPGTRIIDGLVLNPRSGAINPIPATLVLEFYEKANWAWIRVWDDLGAEIPYGGSLLIPAANGQEAITLTADLPVGTPAGLYEGAVYVFDGPDTLTIPIVINVPVSTFPVVIGGNVPTTSLYDNNGVVQGSRSTSPWRQTGDSRYVWATVDVVAEVGRRMIYNAILSGQKSDPEMFMFSFRADAAWPDPLRYGPGTMSLHQLAPGVFAKTKEVVGATDTLYSNREFMHHAPPVSGLIAFQVKSWGSLAETEQFEANIGIMEVAPITFNINTNRLASSVPVTAWSNVPLYDGLGAAVTQSSTTTTTQNFAANPDYFPGGSFNAWMCAQVPPNQKILPAVGAVISRSVDVHITSPSPGDDHDLQVWLDTNDNGVCDPAADTLLCVSADADADEQCVASTPDGTKRIFIQIGIFQAGSDIVNLVCVETILRLGVSAFFLVAPSTTVAPNTPVVGGIGWDLPGSTAPGTQIGKLFVSPGFARFALAVETSITFTYDVTPPTINRALDLSPIPNAAINNPLASVVANVADSRGVDRFTPQLFIDGVDVTGSIKVLAPFPYTPITIAWEHEAAPFDDGRHSAVLNVRDVSGNLRTEVWSWVVDTTAPNLAIVSPSADATTSLSSWAFEATTDPGVTVVLTVNGVSVTPSVSPEGRITATLAFATDGTYDVVVTATDSLGNEATASRTVVRDATLPVVTASADVLSPTNARSTRVSGTVNEAVSALWINGVETAVAADGTFSALAPLDEGTNLITVLTRDAAGNTRSVSLPPIVRDTVAPTITLTALPAVIDQIGTTSVDVAGTVPGADVFFVTVNGRTVTLDASGAFSESFDLAVGDNVFVVQAQDDAGNVAQAVTSVAYTPVVTRSTPNYNSIIASGVAVVLLIVGFVVGYLLSGRGGGPAPAEGPRMKEEAMAEEEIPREQPKQAEEEEL